MKGINKVVDTINKSYDEVSSRLDLIPDWISYCIEYRERITDRQEFLAGDMGYAASLELDAFPKIEYICNIPLSFDRILELKDKFGKDQTALVLRAMKEQPEKFLKFI